MFDSLSEEVHCLKEWTVEVFTRERILKELGSFNRLLERGIFQ